MDSSCTTEPKMPAPQASERYFVNDLHKYDLSRANLAHAGLGHMGMAQGRNQMDFSGEDVHHNHQIADIMDRRGANQRRARYDLSSIDLDTLAKNLSRSANRYFKKCQMGPNNRGVHSGGYNGYRDEEPGHMGHSVDAPGQNGDPENDLSELSRMFDETLATLHDKPRTSDSNHRQYSNLDGQQQLSARRFRSRFDNTQTYEELRRSWGKAQTPSSKPIVQKLDDKTDLKAKFRATNDFHGKVNQPSTDACEFSVMRFLDSLDYKSENVGMPYKPSNEAMELFAFINKIKFPKKYMSRLYRSQYIYSVINGRTASNFLKNPGKHIIVMSVCRRQSSKKSGKWHFINKGDSPFVVVMKALIHMGFYETNEQTWDAIKEFLTFNGLYFDDHVAISEESDEYKKRIIYDVYRLLQEKRYLFRRNVKNPDLARVKSNIVLAFLEGK